jgi:HlyD family secretion protein
MAFQMPRERSTVIFARRAWLATPLVLVAIAAGSYGLYAYLAPRPLPAGFVYGNGHIEGTEIRVASEVTGRVVDSHLVEGKNVAMADLLVRIDDADLRIRLNRSLAEKADLERLRSDQEAQLGPLRHHLATAQADLARYRSLAGSGVASPQRLQQAENALEDAQRQVEVLEGQVSATDAFLDAARQRVELAQSQIAKTEVRAPISGVILVKAIEPGEFATPGKPIAVLVDLRSLQLKVFVPEAEIGKIKLGDQARVSISAFANRFYEARVARVDQQAQFTPRDIHMPEERTRMVFGVTLDLANPTGALKPGMPADAWIRWQDSVRWPRNLTVPQ